MNVLNPHAVRAVVFDVGEILVDETRAWSLHADALGVPRPTFLALLGARHAALMKTKNRE